MIKRIRIQNFRSLRDVTVDLAPLTVLIGRSGTGKSNFANAIRFVRAAAQCPVDVAALNQLQSRIGGWKSCVTAFGLNTETAVLFNVEFQVTDYPGSYEYSLTRHANGSFTSEQLRLDSRMLFAWDIAKPRQQFQWQVTPKAHDVPALDGQPMICRLPILRECQVAYLFLARGISCFDFPGDVLLRNESSQQSGLTDSANNYLDIIKALTLDLKHGLTRVDQIQSALRQLNPSVSTIAVNSGEPRLEVGHMLPDGITLSLPIMQESEGFRRVLAHLLAVWQQPEPQVLVFEEPEKGIHPGALGLLADTFRSVAESGQAQVILVTHSPQLLSYFSADQVRVVELRAGETRIGPVSPEQHASLDKHLLTTDELLTVDLARIENAATISSP